MLRLEQTPISVDAVLAAVRSPSAGGIALFLGTVRDHNLGRSVTGLDYHAYDEMAMSEIRKIEQRARASYQIEKLAMVHRVGSLAVGEIAVAVAVSSAHRDQAFEACRFVIDTLKATVPLWKKEHFDGGEAWIEGS